MKTNKLANMSTHTYLSLKFKFEFLRKNIVLLYILRYLLQQSFQVCAVILVLLKFS